MTENSLIIRLADEHDMAAVRRLAQLDSRPVPSEPVLVAFSDEMPLAALSLLDDRVVATPFESSAGAVQMLQMRAEHLQPGHRPRGVGRLLSRISASPRSQAGLAGSPPGAGGRLIHLHPRA